MRSAQKKKKKPRGEQYRVTWLEDGAKELHEELFARHKGGIDNKLYL